MVIPVNARDSMLQAGSRTANSIKNVVLNADKNVFTYSGTGVISPSTQYVTLTAIRINTIEPVIWSTSPTCVLRTTTDPTSTIITQNTTTIVTVAYAHAIDFVTATTSTGAIAISAGILDISALVSTIVLSKLQVGSNGISVILSNDAHTLSASSTGIVSNYLGADTYITVFNGGTDDTSSWAFSKADINVHSRFESGVLNHVIVDGFDSTKLLLHGTGTAGSTSIIDSSISANTIINPGTAVTISTSNAKYDQAIAFSGTSTSYLEIDWIPDFKLSNLEFAIQVQAYIPSMLSSRQFLLGWWGAGTNTADHSWALLIGIDGKLNFDYSSAYDNADYTIISTAVIPVGIITELAVGRVGNILTLKIGTTIETFAFNKTIRTIGSVYTGTQPDNFLLPQVFNYL